MIENSIREQALKSSELTNLIGNNFHLTTSHDSKDKFVLIRVIDDRTPVELHLEDGQNTANVQFDCYAKSPQTTKQIAKAINKHFNKRGFQSDDLKVQLAIKQYRLPSFDTDSGLYRESLDYTFYYNEV